MPANATMDQMFRAYQSNFGSLSYDQTRLEALVRGIVGTDQSIHTYFSYNPRQIAGQGIPLFDILVLTRLRLYVFTAYQGGKVGAAVVSVRTLEAVSIDEDGTNMTLTFGFGTGSSIILTDAMSNSTQLMEFQRSVTGIAWAP